MQLSKKGLELIKEFEAFRAIAYKDTGGVLTIGYGHALSPRELRTGRLNETGVVWRNGLTRQQIDDLLKVDSLQAVDAINDLVSYPITQNQFDALVSFVFNIGRGQFKISTLLKKLNQGNYAAIPKEMRKWVYDNGKKIKGLANRREKEIKLFLGEV